MAMDENGSGKLLSLGAPKRDTVWSQYFERCQYYEHGAGEFIWIDEAFSYPLDEVADPAPAAAHPVGDAPEIPVTPQMNAAGYEATKNERCLGDKFIWLDGSRLPMGGIDDFRGLFSVIFRAMAAVAPFELVSRGEMAELRKREKALDSLTFLKAAIASWAPSIYHVGLDERRPATQADIDGMESALLTMGAQLAARDANIADLKSQLAARPAPVPDTPKATPDFTRDFSGDRRRVGG